MHNDVSRWNIFTQERRKGRKQECKKTSKEDLLNFTFEGADKERCPLLREILTAAIRTGKTDGKDMFWQSAIVTAAAVCL